MTCPCGCTGPLCCDCCVYWEAETEMERRERVIVERLKTLGVDL